MELETYVMIAGRLGYVSTEASKELLARIEELSKILTALRKRLLEER